MFFLIWNFKGLVIFLQLAFFKSLPFFSIHLSEEQKEPWIQPVAGGAHSVPVVKVKNQPWLCPLLLQIPPANLQMCILPPYSMCTSVCALSVSFLLSSAPVAQGSLSLPPQLSHSRMLPAPFRGIFIKSGIYDSQQPVQKVLNSYTK